MPKSNQRPPLLLTLHLDGSGTRRVVHEGQFSEGVSGFQCAEGLTVVFPGDEYLR